MNPKKLFFLIASLVTISLSARSSVVSLAPVLPANDPGKNPKQEQRIQQMKWFVHLTTAEYGKLRGKKLNFIERVSFKFTQHRMKQMLAHYKWDEPTILSKISWLFKGLLLGPIALLIIYLIARDEEKELIKWVWFGFAGWVALVAIILLAS